MSTERMRPHVLVVDRDRRVRELLRVGLGGAGFIVQVVPTAADALTGMKRQAPDVIALDVTLPDTECIDLFRLRARARSVPVLFLNPPHRRTIPGMRSEIMNSGDDSISKPFNVAEVEVKLRALLANFPAAGDSPVPLRCADLTVDEAGWRVFRGGNELSLSPTEFRLLALLVRNQGRALSKPQILQEVWGYDFGGKFGVVERFVSNLRRKIDDGRVPLIHTVRGLGYSLHGDPVADPELAGTNLTVG
jgi:two-component system OmpR family response regulator